MALSQVTRLVISRSTTPARLRELFAERLKTEGPFVITGKGSKARKLEETLQAENPSVPMRLLKVEGESEWVLVVRSNVWNKDWQPIAYWMPDRPKVMDRPEVTK